MKPFGVEKEGEGTQLRDSFPFFYHCGHLSHAILYAPKTANALTQVVEYLAVSDH
jgi:hypothetical protein